MTTFDDERDETERDEDELRSAPGQGNRPLLMVGLALALMLGGYAATNYVPMTERQAETSRRLQELRLLAEQSKEAGVKNELPERLDRIAQPWREPPYQMAGRLAIYGGLFLFVFAVVMMYRSSPPGESRDRMKE